MDEFSSIPGPESIGSSKSKQRCNSKTMHKNKKQAKRNNHSQNNSKAKNKINEGYIEELGLLKNKKISQFEDANKF